jgi:transcriptional regulator with XRE-family HTH domain
MSNLEALRDDVRAYLRGKRFQAEIAQQMGVSYSWLNKFINGQFPNLSAGRLEKLAKWVSADRATQEAAAGRMTSASEQHSHSRTLAGP